MTTPFRFTADSKYVLSVTRLTGLVVYSGHWQATLMGHPTTLFTHFQLAIKTVAQLGRNFEGGRVRRVEEIESIAGKPVINADDVTM